MKTPSNSEDEKLIRSLYAVAETQNSTLFTSLFTEDGYFYDVSAGVKYYGNEINLGAAIHQ